MHAVQAAPGLVPRCRRCVENAHGCVDDAQTLSPALWLTTCREKRGKSSTSAFRGVTHHVRTNRWESHIWEDGKQLYLGGFDSEEQVSVKACSKYPKSLL